MNAEYLVFVVIYFAAMLGIGIWVSRRIKGGDDYILAGRKVPLWPVVGGIVGTWINSATLMGFGGMGHSVGIAGYWSGGAFMLMGTWMGWWMIPRLRRTGIVTIPELFERYFGINHRIVAVLLVIGRDLGVTAGVSIAMAIMFQFMFGVSLLTALVITLAVVLVYTLLGGMWAVMYTDLVQSIIILIGTVLVIPLAVSALGGWSAMTSAIPATHSQIMNAGIPQSAGWFLTGVLITAAYQTIIQRGLAAESDETAKKAFLYGGLITIVWYMVPFVIGTLGRTLYPDVAARDIYLHMITHIGGPIWGAFFFTALLASCMSTVDSCVLTVSSNLANDIYKRLVNPKISEQGLITVQKVCVVVVAVAAVVIGRALPMVLELFWVGGRIMAAALAPVLIALVFWPKARRCRVSTMAAMLMGSGFTVYQQFFGAKYEAGTAFLWRMDPILMGFPIATAVLIIGVLLETRRLDKSYSHPA
jgi:SSS family solute:Na+ symporter